MKILIVVPRYQLTERPHYQYLFPMGLGYISAVLKRAGHSVDAINLNHHHGAIASLVKERLDAQTYGAVLTGHMGIGYNIVKAILDAAAAHPTRPKTVVGGFVITPEPALMLESLKADYVCIGEAEQTIVELIACIENQSDPALVNGIGFVNAAGETVITKERAAIADLDSLPYPDFEGLGYDTYIENTHSNMLQGYMTFDKPKIYPLIASRDCPYKCTFCYHPATYRTRSLDNVFEELRHNIKRFKINTIMIYDDLFSIKKPRLYEFCKRITELRNEVSWDLKWFCQLTVRDLDDEMLRTLKAAGCFAISFGFESMSPTVLKSMKKPATRPMIEKVFNLAMKHNIVIIANYIFGDPAETVATATDTLDYWKNNCRGQVNLGFIQPYPGSTIYSICVKNGLIKDRLSFIKNDIGIGQVPTLYNITEGMTDEEFAWLRKEVDRSFAQHNNFSVPSLKKRRENIYRIKLKCQFCKKDFSFDNFYIRKKISFIWQMNCPECGKKFYAVSRLRKMLYRNYPVLNPILVYVANKKASLMKRLTH